MYSLQDTGLIISALPPPRIDPRPTDELEQRAVEATESGSLTTGEQPNVMFNSTAAALQLVRTSARDYAAMLREVNQRTAARSDEFETGPTAGQVVDVFA